jgi:hypothetical protein
MGVIKGAGVRRAAECFSTKKRKGESEIDSLF